MIASLLNAIFTKLSEKFDFVILLARFSVGMVFAKTGYGKITDLESIAQFFESINIIFPAFNAALVGWTEFIGGILLILGVASRLVSIPLAITMAVAILTAHASDIGNIFDLFNEVPWNYLLFFLIFLFYGPGKYSFDQMLCKKFFKS